jgi:hypothetical protein
LLGPRLAPFCIAGVIGVYATMGAYDGCISDANDNSTTVGCFPGASLVYTRTSGPRRMSELRVGDEVGNYMTAIFCACFGHEIHDASLVSRSDEVFRQFLG